MGCFVHNVSTVKKISVVSYAFNSVRWWFHGLIYSALIDLGNVLLDVPVLRKIRHRFYDLAHSLYGYWGLPSTRVINGRHYLETPIDEDEARRLLVDIGAESSFSIKPVYALENGDYVFAYAYYDGGSDGHDEYKYFKKIVEDYFANELAQST